MVTIYPDPPHLSLFVHANTDAAQSIRSAIEVLAAASISFDGPVLVSGDGSDSSDARLIEVDDLTAADCDLTRVMRARFRHPERGVVALARSGRDVSSYIEVSLHAGVFELPVQFWGPDGPSKASDLMAWSESLLVDLASAIHAPYGALGVEVEFPTPSNLQAAIGQPLLRPTTWFWSDSVETNHPDAARELRHRLGGRILRVGRGSLFRGWFPPERPTADDDGVADVLSFLHASCTGAATSTP